MARRRPAPAIVAAVGLGVAVAIPVELAVRALGRWVGVDPKAQVTGALAAMLATFLLFAPLEEASKVGVLWPFRKRWLRDARQGLLLAASIAIGFSCVETGFYLRDAIFPASSAPAAAAHGISVLVVLRSALGTVARVLTAAAWGYALGGTPPNRRPTRGFWLTLVAVTALRGLCDHLVFGRGLASLLGSMPLLLGMIAVAYGAAQELAPDDRESGPSSRALAFLPSLPPPPSLGAMRDALRRAEQPVMLHWIGLGMLVTMGVVIGAVVGAVLVGRRAGVDFGAVDEGELTGAVPLALVGLAVLCAFLLSGYLVARASGAESVLEPALSAALAIVATLVLLGLAAPVALVFALAFAPIAFGLACTGAWVGIGAAVPRPRRPRRGRRRA